MPQSTETNKWGAVRKTALSLPASWDDFPWDEVVIKVNKKIFVFLGHPGSGPHHITVKLTHSHDHAMSVAGAAPTAYGMGKYGWVTVPIARVDTDLLSDWVEESYRNIAPKRLVAQLDQP